MGMEPYIDKQENPTGGDFMNRPHEPLLHPILHPLTLARFYGKHHEQLSTSDPRQALALAEQFCREDQVEGLDTSTPMGFDWVIRPNVRTGGMDLELWKGASVALIHVTDPAAIEQALNGRALLHPALARAYTNLPDDHRAGLLSELRESIDQVQANRIAGHRLQAMRAQPELPSLPRPPLDIAGLLQRYEVPEDQAKATEQHLLQAHGGALSAMHGSQVLAAAHAHSNHPGFYGAPWHAWLCENATTGDLAGVDACLGMGAEPDVPNTRGDMPLHLAARHGHQVVLRRLVEAGADPSLGNPKGETPLHFAAQHKHARCCLELLAAGADPGHLDREGRKPGDVHRGRGKGREQAIGL